MKNSRSTPLNLNDSLKHNSKPLVRATKSAKSWFASIDFVVLEKGIVYAGVLLLYFVLLAIVGLMVIGIPSVIYCTIKDHHAREVAREEAEARLATNGWTYIETCHNDWISAELLARKRSDAEFGVDNYLFDTTNTQCKLWYKATPKKDTSR